MKRNALWVILAVVSALACFSLSAWAQNGTPPGNAPMTPPVVAPSSPPGPAATPGTAAPTDPLLSSSPGAASELPPAPAPEEGSILPWIIGGIVLLALIAAVAYLSSQKRGQVIAATKGGATRLRGDGEPK